MSEDLILSHRARVSIVTLDTKRVVETLAERGISVDEENLFPFRAEISNTLLDSHYTHMSERTLSNYAEDALTGVAFLKGHNHREIPVGYSISGLVENEGSRVRTIADFYTIRGLSETNDLITRMQTGLLRDVSVGFHGGEMNCDICHEDFWECRHWPGLKYEIKEGDEKRMVTATYTIDGARLSEVSGVFDGSTPNAMILKAQRHAASGRLPAKQVELLEQSYRVRLSAKTTFAVNGKASQGETRMNEKQVERIRECVVNSGIVPEDQRDTIKDDETLLVYVDKLVVRLQTLEPQAEEGRTYRKDLVTAAIQEGVRALGNDFDKAGYQTMLESASLSTIKRVMSDFKKVADAALPAGRATTDEGSPAPNKTEVAAVPNSFYR